MLRTWQNESTFGKHDHVSNVAATMCPRFAGALQPVGKRRCGYMVSCSTCDTGPALTHKKNTHKHEKPRETQGNPGCLGGS